MSSTQFAMGGVAVAGILQLAVSVVLPDPSPIVVHSLRYVESCTYRGVQYENCIEQDRTINSDDEFFYMFWEAAIRDDNGPVEECSGGGSWKYAVGRSAVAMPGSVWTGNDACDIGALPPGKYTPIAVWYFGEEQVAKRGAPFTVPPT